MLGVWHDRDVVPVTSSPGRHTHRTRRSSSSFVVVVEAAAAATTAYREGGIRVRRRGAGLGLSQSGGLSFSLSCLSLGSLSSLSPTSCSSHG